jgi:hypothetical protein
MTLCMLSFAPDTALSALTLTRRSYPFIPMASGYILPNSYSRMYGKHYNHSRPFVHEHISLPWRLWYTCVAVLSFNALSRFFFGANNTIHNHRFPSLSSPFHHKSLSFAASYNFALIRPLPVRAVMHVPHHIHHGTTCLIRPDYCARK